jgi:hypothetical protein
VQANLLIPFAATAPSAAAGVNLIVAWACVFLGFLSGGAIGLKFHEERWLGGFGSLKRRLYRLAHISFFGLGAVNLMFWLTQRAMVMSEPFATWASWGFVTGAMTMPPACVLMAHFSRSRPLFVVPVVSLIAAAGLTLWAVLQTIRELP